MRCLLLFNGICLLANISSSYHIKKQSSENSIPSSSGVITTSTIETTLDTEIWYDYSFDTTMVSTFNETSDIPAETAFATDILSTSKFQSEDSTEDFSTTRPLDLNVSVSSSKATDIAEMLESNIAMEPATNSSLLFHLFTSVRNSSESTITAGVHEQGTITMVPDTTDTSSLPLHFTSVRNDNTSTIATEVHEQRNASMEPNTTVNIEEYFKSSTAALESPATESSTFTSWSATTNARKLKPHLIKIRDQKTALNIIDMETSESEGLKCGQRFQRIPRVIGGIRSLAGEFPWMVSVRVLTSHFCGGVIINKDWILTAGHCVRRFAARYWRIRLGGQDVNIDQFRPQWDIPVSKVIVHPKFGTPARYSFDMALMKLQRSIRHTDFAAPICLPENLEEKYDGVNATVIGWGRTDEDTEETSSVLQKVFIPVVNNSLCAEYYRKVHYGYIRVRDYQICAGLREGGRDACKGDSGGPLVKEEKDGRYTLLGITSAGVGCGRSQLPGIYSRATYFVPWILKVTGGYTHWPLQDDYDDY